jgi:hypothetical protein
VLVNYRRNVVSVSRSIYIGPHKKHADKAYWEVCVLGLHGILTDCTVRFFDGFRLREEMEKTYPISADIDSRIAEHARIGNETVLDVELVYTSEGR